MPAESIGSKKDRRPEDTLERGNQPPILFTAFMHAEGFEHFCSGSKSDRLALLPDGERGQVNRNDPILAKGKPVVGMSRNLEHEIAIPPFVNRLRLGAVS